jgi:pyrimidine operon attenuation protein/uracil phosphoribosyltransferase
MDFTSAIFAKFQLIYIIRIIQNKILIMIHEVLFQGRFVRSDIPEMNNKHIYTSQRRKILLNTSGGPSSTTMVTILIPWLNEE